MEEVKVRIEQNKHGGNKQALINVSMATAYLNFVYVRYSVVQFIDLDSMLYVFLLYYPLKSFSRDSRYSKKRISNSMYNTHTNLPYSPEFDILLMLRI